MKYLIVYSDGQAPDQADELEQVTLSMINEGDAEVFQNHNGDFQRAVVDGGDDEDLVIAEWESV